MGNQPGLIAVVREKMRTRHLALRTEQAYVQWLRRFIAFHRRKHPREVGCSRRRAILDPSGGGPQGQCGHAEPGAPGAVVCVPARAGDRPAVAGRRHACRTAQAAASGADAAGGSRASRATAGDCLAAGQPALRQWTASDGGAAPARQGHCDRAWRDSSCASQRAAGTVSRRFPPCSRRRCARTSRGCGPGSRKSAAPGGRASRCPLPWRVSTHSLDPVGLAVPVPLRGTERRSGAEVVGAPSHARERHPACGPGGRAQGGHQQAGKLSYAASLLRHPPAGGWL